MDYYRSNVNKNKYWGLKSPKEYSESNATSFWQEQRIYSPISHSTQKHNVGLSIFNIDITIFSSICEILLNNLYISKFSTLQMQTHCY